MNQGAAKVTGETSRSQSHFPDQLSVRPGLLRLSRFIGVFLIALASFRLAWISDDALISLRTALNTSHGWGPGYNATEAVQAYTHPLWFLIWLVVGNLTNQWLVGILLVSVGFTALATGIVLFCAPSISRIVVITGVLLFSNAFMEYSTSGLENPLLYAGVALLGLLTLRGLQATSPAWAIAFGLTAAAIVLTRFDAILLIAPWLILMVWHLRTDRRIVVIGGVAAATPLILWFTWSYITYATWLPNTFEAKRNVDIPTTELIIQGFRYLMVSFEKDPVTLIGLIFGVGAAFFLGNLFTRVGALGVLTYLGYIIWIGGDFMAGRFLAVPLFMSMLLVAAIALHRKEDSATAISAAIVAAIALMVGSSAAGSTPVSLSNPREARWEVDQNFNAGVSDERGSYVALGRDLKGFIDNLSLGFVDPVTVPAGDLTGLNRPLRNLDRTAKEWPTHDGSFILPSETVPMCGFMGTIGIVTGPTTHLVDTCALTDRFLASRPFTPVEPFAWKPGHFHREVPQGYLEAIATNDPTKVMDFEDRFELEQLWSQIRSPKS